MASLSKEEKHFSPGTKERSGFSSVLANDETLFIWTRMISRVLPRTLRFRVLNSRCVTDAPPQIYFRGIEPDPQFNYRDPLGACWELGFKVSLNLSEVTIFILRSTRVKKPGGSGSSWLVSNRDFARDIASRMNCTISNRLYIADSFKI